MPILGIMAICWGATCNIPLVTSACGYEVQVPSWTYDCDSISLIHQCYVWHHQEKKRALPVVLSSQTGLYKEDDATVTFSTKVQSLFMLQRLHPSTTSLSSSALTDICITGSKYLYSIGKWQIIPTDYSYFRLFLIARSWCKKAARSFTAFI